MYVTSKSVSDETDAETSRARVASNVRSVELCARMAWLRNEASGTLAVTEFHNLIGLDRHQYCWIRDRNFHEVAPNAIQGTTATVRGSMDQVAMTGQGYEAGWPR